MNHLGRNYDVVGVFNFAEGKSEQTVLRWADLGLPSEQLLPSSTSGIRNTSVRAAGTMVEAAPTSCRVLTLLPDTGKIELLSTSRHITQGWVDLVLATHQVR